MDESEEREERTMSLDIFLRAIFATFLFYTAIVLHNMAWEMRGTINAWAQAGLLLVVAVCLFLGCYGLIGG